MNKMQKILSVKQEMSILVEVQELFEQAGKGCFDFRFWLWFGA